MKIRFKARDNSSPLVCDIVVNDIVVGELYYNPESEFYRINEHLAITLNCGRAMNTTFTRSTHEVTDMIKYRHHTGTL